MSSGSLLSNALVLVNFLSPSLRRHAVALPNLLVLKQYRMTCLCGFPTPFIEGWLRDHQGKSHPEQAGKRDWSLIFWSC